MKKQGFTLVELMIVIAIISILASILMPKFTQARSKSIATACKANLKNIATGLEMYATNNNHTYPSALSTLTPQYLRAVPSCPTGTTAYGYTRAGNFYTVYCNTSGNPHTTGGCGATGYPQYNSAGGLKSL